MEHPPLKPILVHTVRDHLREGYEVTVYCVPCDRQVVLDLAQMIRRGMGDRKMVGLRLVCQACGRPGQAIVNPNPGSVYSYPSNGGRHDAADCP